MDWDKCLSHQIWPAIEKGWKDEDRPIHFFWGFDENNIPEIKQCIDQGEEWWFVDVGYITEQITRYPEPKIHNFDKTYFRVIKGAFHTVRGSVPAEHTRVTELEHKGIGVKFKGWNTKGENIILAPSSTTVTRLFHRMTQDQWVEATTREIKKYTDRPIILRKKPKPSNQWWGTDIKDDFKNAHCLVTSMSLSAVEAVLNMVPVITHQRNVCAVISGTIDKIEEPMKPSKKTMQGFIKLLAENQFTIGEIENGTAYYQLQRQAKAFQK
jgi:hypothetical protein